MRLDLSPITSALGPPTFASSNPGLEAMQAIANIRQAQANLNQTQLQNQGAQNLLPGLVPAQQAQTNLANQQAGLAQEQAQYYPEYVQAMSGRYASPIQKEIAGMNMAAQSGDYATANMLAAHLRTEMTGSPLSQLANGAQSSLVPTFPSAQGSNQNYSVPQTANANLQSMQSNYNNLTNQTNQVANQIAMQKQAIAQTQQQLAARNPGSNVFGIGASTGATPYPYQSVPSYSVTTLPGLRGVQTNSFDANGNPISQTSPTTSAESALQTRASRASEMDYLKSSIQNGLRPYLGVGGSLQLVNDINAWNQTHDPALLQKLQNYNDALSKEGPYIQSQLAATGGKSSKYAIESEEEKQFGTQPYQFLNEFLPKDVLANTIGNTSNAIDQGLVAAQQQAANSYPVSRTNTQVSNPNDGMLTVRRISDGQIGTLPKSYFTDPTFNKKYVVVNNG